MVSVSTLSHSANLLVRYRAAPWFGLLSRSFCLTTRLATVQSPLCCLQNEQGAYEPIMPVSELERMYQRILAQELVVNEPQPAPASAAGGTRPRRASRLQGWGLTAAVGMTQMTLPFRSACRLSHACCPGAHGVYG